MNEYKPSLLCRLIGHKWKLFTYDDGEWRKGYMSPNCVRCGCENPMFASMLAIQQRQEKEDKK